MIDSKKVDILIDDIEYLKYEAQSLHQVIEFVPYSEKPLDGASIIEMLLTIDSIQLKFINVIEQIPIKGIHTKVDEFDIYQRVELSEEEVKNTQISVVSKDLETNREELLEKIPHSDPSFFEIEFDINNGKASIFDLLSDMVNKERALLKEVADLVLTYQTDRQFQREIASRKQQRS